MFTYFRDEVLGCRAHLNAMLGLLWPANRRMLNQIVHLILIRIVKWRDANYHLVDENAERPPVKCFVVSTANDHLGG